MLLQFTKIVLSRLKQKRHLHLSYLKKAAGIKSGSGRPNTEKVGKVTRAQLEEIVETKEPDLTASDLMQQYAPLLVLLVHGLERRGLING